ncbi:MAG: hypothetical protein ACI9MR_002232 [Myxococcota bacterium]|jgi:hypothetical protein
MSTSKYSVADSTAKLISEGERYIQRVETSNLIFALVAVLLTHLLAGAGPILYGVIVGAAACILNLRGMVWLGRRIIAAPKKSRGFYLALFGTKIAALMAGIWLVLSNFEVAPLGFLIGFSTILPASVTATLMRGLAPAEPAQSASPANGEPSL